MTDCSKVQYTSKRQARLANRRNHKSLRAYVCDECGFWHMSKHRSPSY